MLGRPRFLQIRDGSVELFEVSDIDFQRPSLS
jgi:hypothetical protein